jgi:spore coat protein U domain-containing protein, fimbrial subunit CupE1/2/3/6
MCLLAAWTGLEGARTPTSAQVPLVCAISDGNLDFKTIPVSNNIPSAAIAPGFLTINCPSAPPNSTVWVCVKAQTLPMGTLPRAVALLYYDVAAVNKQVSTNGGKVPIEGTISKNQQKIPADSYVGNVFMSNVTYSATNCLTAPTTAIPQPGLYASAVVPNSCFVTTNPLDFGSTSSLEGGQTGSTTIAVRCNYNTKYTVALGGGNSNATDPEQRKMTGPGGATITYGLYYQDTSGKTMPWAPSQGLQYKTYVGSPDLTVYGRVPPQPTPAAGGYSDTIVVTVFF